MSHSGINPGYKKRKKEAQKADHYVDGILSGDRYILSEAITLVESELAEKQALASAVLAQLIDRAGKTNTQRIAITGAPGVGKSTFIEHFGYYLLGKGHRLAVLAVDPSSPLFKGSILGDKTRMHQLSQKGEVYIRPSSSGAILGGVSKGTKEAIFLCEAAGYDTILVETVGVGQSEAWASKMTDVTFLLIQPGAGDEIQGIKRGILEMADLVIVNKADGEQNDLASKTARAYAQAMTLFQPRYEAFQTSVLTASSLEEKGFDAIHQFVVDFHAFLIKEKYLEKVRAEQEVFWFDANVRERIMQAVMQRLDFSALVTTLRDRIKQEHTPSFLALNEIDRLIQNRLNT